MRTTGLTRSEISAFRRKVYLHFKRHCRDLPWRHTTNPYRIVVSEIMLQQTQVDRVVIKYPQFIRRFPSFAALARATTRDALEAWQGLGYNRRALMLHKLAQEVHCRFHGRLPDTPEALGALPGIGPATAASIAAYAFNKPAVFIETNIRAVFIHHFFPGRSSVADSQIRPLVEQTLDTKNPSKWYNALMDLGTMLKKRHANPARRSAGHMRQSRFEGSDRQVRGAILRQVLASPRPLSVSGLAKAIGTDAKRVERIARIMVAEGFITLNSRGLRSA